jgi:hypothetical protein
MVNMTLIGQKSSLNKLVDTSNGTRAVGKESTKYKTRHDKHCVDHNFQVGDEVWIYISNERLKGEGKQLKPIQYGPFNILDKIGNNVFRLDLPPYMQMYAVVNVENLKLYEPTLIDDQGERV